MAVLMERLIETFSFATSGTTAGVSDVTHNSWDMHGWAKVIKVTMPAFANLAASGTLTVKDPEGATLLTKAQMLPNTTTIITGADLPFVGGETVTLTLAANPSGAATTINQVVTVIFTCSKTH